MMQFALNTDRRVDVDSEPVQTDGSAGQRDPCGSTAALASVVIPCYNHARFLREAILSALDQTYPSIEIIVVNDGSTDDPQRVVAEFPMVRYIVQENRGLALARNAGLAHCRGDLVVFLDADDRLLPGAIEAGARMLASNPSVGFAVGYSRLISREGVPRPTTNQPVSAGEDAYAALLRRNTIRNPATVVFRRQLVAAVGGFASGVDACADYDLYLRISRDYPVVFHDTVVADYRSHGANMSNNSARMLREALAVLRRQRSHLASRSHRAAFKEGVRNIRIYYGDRLTMQIRAHLRARSEWRQALRDVAAMIRWHPVGALREVRKKIAVLWRSRDAHDPA
jgi:glycosyltransferase involved in cell wall biosynthesis